MKRLVLALLLWGTAVVGQENTRRLEIMIARLPSEAQRLLLERPEELIRQQSAIWEHYAINGVMSQAALKIREERRLAEIRGRLIGRILMADLDGDLIITPAERARIAIVGRPGREPPLWQLLRDRPALMGQSVSIEDVSDYAREVTPDFFRPEREIDPLIWDLNDNGLVSASEMSSAIRAASNHLRGRSAGAAADSCDLSTLSADTQVFAITAESGGALSTVALASQTSITTVVDILIEPGDGPLVVALIPTGPTIWKFSGATDRIIDTMILGRGERIASGTVGLNPDQVRLVLGAHCLPHTLRETAFGEADRRVAHADLGTTFGHPVDALLTARTILSVRLPSGEGRVRSSLGGTRRGIAAVTSEGVKEQLTREPFEPRPLIGPLTTPYESNTFEKLFPGGVVPVDPETVVAGAPVARYELLPGLPGILQLLSRQAIERVDQSNSFLIRTHIPRLPRHIGSQGSAPEFLLPEGIKPPLSEADLGRTISLATGRCMAASPRCER